MKPVTTITGTAAPLDRANVDTDQIMPKQFLKRVERTGYGEFVFWDWKRLPDGSLDPNVPVKGPGRSVFDLEDLAGCLALPQGEAQHFRVHFRLGWACPRKLGFGNLDTILTLGTDLELPLRYPPHGARRQELDSDPQRLALSATRVFKVK